MPSIETDVFIQRCGKPLKVMATFELGKDEAEVCSGEGTSTNRVACCTKNPGHEEFIPVKEFNSNYLPVAFRDNKVCQTIKTFAELTVQVKTKFTSLERPEFYPGTQVPYPCFMRRGSHVMRLGTGRVWYVNSCRERDSSEPCRCAKCQVSATPSKVWGKIVVLTAAHVVFDASEARCTTCVLDFDDSSSHVLNLDGWEIWESDVKRDWCEMAFVSCDMNLIERLYNLRHRFVYQCLQVNNKYANILQDEKLAVVISHPHGMPKQVSVGRWIQKHETEGWTRYTYTTCTCPGSSGAPVYKLGEDGEHWSHPHCGANSEGNYSCQRLY